MQTEKSKELTDIGKIIEQLGWRYAVKKFDPGRRIEEREWRILEQAVILAPSSYGLQPYRFFVITNEDLKRKLRPACYGQPQITESSHLVVLAAKKELTDRDIEEFVALIQKERGTPREMLEDYIGMMKGTKKQLEESGTATIWAQKQVYIALGFLLETAALLGIDACPMEGFQADSVDEILGLEDYTATVLCTLGYRSDDDWLAALAKVRFPAENLIRRI